MDLYSPTCGSKENTIHTYIYSKYREIQQTKKQGKKQQKKAMASVIAILVPKLVAMATSLRPSITGRPRGMCSRLSRYLASTANAGCTVRINSAGSLITIFDKLWGGYKTFRPRLIPGGVDAYAFRPDRPTLAKPFW